MQEIIEIYEKMGYSRKKIERVLQQTGGQVSRDRIINELERRGPATAVLTMNRGAGGGGGSRSRGQHANSSKSVSSAAREMGMTDAEYKEFILTKRKPMQGSMNRFDALMNVGEESEAVTKKEESSAKGKKEHRNFAEASKNERQRREDKDSKAKEGTARPKRENRDGSEDYYESRSLKVLTEKYENLDSMIARMEAKAMSDLGNVAENGEETEDLERARKAAMRAMQRKFTQPLQVVQQEGSSIASHQPLENKRVQPSPAEQRSVPVQRSVPSKESASNTARPAESAAVKPAPAKTENVVPLTGIPDSVKATEAGKRVEPRVKREHPSLEETSKPTEKEVEHPRANKIPQLHERHAGEEDEEGMASSPGQVRSAFGAFPYGAPMDLGGFDPRFAPPLAAHALPDGGVMVSPPLGGALPHLMTSQGIDGSLPPAASGGATEYHLSMSFASGGMVPSVEAFEHSREGQMQGAPEMTPASPGLHGVHAGPSDMHAHGAFYPPFYDHGMAPSMMSGPPFGYMQMAGDMMSIPAEVVLSHPVIRKIMEDNSQVIESLKAELSQAKDEMSFLSAAKEGIANERDSLVKDVKRLERAIEEHEARALKYSEETQKALAQLHEVDDRRLDEASQFQAQVEKYATDLDEAQREIEQLKSMFENERDIRISAEGTMKRYSTQCEALSSALAMKENQVKEVTEELEILREHRREDSATGGIALPPVLRAVERKFMEESTDLEKDVMKLIEKHIVARSAPEEVLELKTFPNVLKYFALLLVEGSQLPEEKAKLGLLQTVRSAALQVFSSYKAESLASIAMSLSEGELVFTGKIRGRGRGRAAALRDPRKREVRSLSALLFAVASLVRGYDGSLPSPLGWNWAELAKEVAAPAAPSVSLAIEGMDGGPVGDSSEAKSWGADASPSLDDDQPMAVGVVGDRSSAASTKGGFEQALQHLETLFPKIRKSILNGHLRAANADVGAAAMEIINDLRRGQIGDGTISDAELRIVMTSIQQL